MGKFDGILICTDYDGTLGFDGKISEENRAAIRYFQENGGLFTIVSGRNPNLLLKWVRELGLHVNAPLVGYNGAWIIDPVTEETLFSGGRSDFRAVDFLKPFWEKDERIIELLPHSTAVWLPRCRRGDENPDPEKLKTPESLPFYNILAITATEEDALALREEMIAAAGDEFEIARSWSTGIELINPQDRKGVAIRRVQAATGAKTVVAVGDYENDYTMIRDADVSYAVANAVGLIKQTATRQTVHCREHALAAVIADLEARGV